MDGQRLIPSLRREHSAFENAGDPAGNDMGAAQIGLGESNQYAAMFVAGGEVDITDQARRQPGGIEARAFVDGIVEGKTRDRQRETSVGSLYERLAEVAPERLAGEQAALGIKHPFRLERL